MVAGLPDLRPSARATMEPMTIEAAPVFNPLDPLFRADPYPTYHRLREVDPVHRSLFGSLVLTRYDDCAKVLRSPHASSDLDRHLGYPERRLFTGEEIPPPTISFRESSMLNLDPPTHTRLRSLSARAFTPKAIDGWRPRMQAIVDGLVDDALAAGGLELIADLAFPFPFQVISELLGIPVSDRDEMRTWSQAITRTLEPMVTLEELQAADTALVAMVGYLDRVIADRRRDLGDDVLSGLIAAEEAGDRLSTEELYATVVLLYLAGHETTVNLIGNGTLALLGAPRQAARIRDEPSLDLEVADELLRFDGPVQFTVRIITEALELDDGTKIGVGEIVMPVLGAANHDPSVFPSPDEVRLMRPDANRHLGFSSGIHFCLGSMLARAEAATAITTLIRRCPNLALAAEPDWSDRITLRGLRHLRLLC